VLPPERAAGGGDARPAEAGTPTETEMAGAVTEQYWKAAHGIFEIMRFGGMLEEVDRHLANLSRQIGRKRNAHGNQHGADASEISLTAWLGEHCPDVNYKTAMSFKSLSDGLREHFKIPARIPMQKLLPSADGWLPVARREKWTPKTKIEKLQRDIYALLDSHSKTGLEVVFGIRKPKRPAGGARPGAGRPEREPDAARDAGAAWGRLGGLIDLAMGWRFARFLPEAMAREALETVTGLRDALRERIDELKKGGA
jgi:hypothetical protein